MFILGAQIKAKQSPDLLSASVRYYIKYDGALNVFLIS